MFSDELKIEVVSVYKKNDKQDKTIIESSLFFQVYLKFTPSRQLHI